MTTYPLPTLAPTLTPDGITAPPYSDILLSLQASYRLIYGADVYLEADSQDGQWLAIEAKAIADSNAAIIAVYNSFSPATAVGVALSNVVKINGIRRRSATYSTVELSITGDPYTVILNGAAIDTLNQKWNLPSSVTIPSGGSIVVTGTSAILGDIRADSATVTTIGTPTRGWTGVNNASPATAGIAIETDSELRQQQSASTGNAAQTPLEAIVGTVEQVIGVTRVKAYENDTGITDGNGVPAHSICLVVEGGTDGDIAAAIALKKNPGTGTYGTTTVLVVDSNGVPNEIHFYRPTMVRIIGTINATALSGYVSSTADSIKQSVADYGNTLDVGDDVYLSKIEASTQLSNAALARTYNVTSVLIAKFGNTPAASDIALTFIEAATFDPADLTTVVT